MCCSQEIRIIKRNTIRWAGYAANTEERGNAYRGIEPLGILGIDERIARKCILKNMVFAFTRYL